MIERGSVTVAAAVGDAAVTMYNATTAAAATAAAATFVN
jgi:hypothetical protein